MFFVSNILQESTDQNQQNPAPPYFFPEVFRTTSFTDDLTKPLSLKDPGLKNCPLENVPKKWRLFVLVK